jgi:multidrug efflux pump subunit AcrA (membrane-fusion protein)
MTWFVIAVAVVAIGVGYIYYAKLQLSKNNATAIATSRVSTGDIVLAATGSGTLIPNQQVSFGFKKSGKISDVLVKLGDHVKTGQVLARVDDPTVQLEYNQAQANLAALSSPSSIATAEQTLQDAKASYATARDTLQGLIGPDLLVAEDNFNNAQQQVELTKAAAEKNPSAGNNKKVTDAEATLTKMQSILARAQNDYTGKYVLQMFIYPVRNSHGVTTSRQLFAPTDVEISAAHATYEIAIANLNDAQNYVDVLNGTLPVDQVPASSITQINEAQTTFDQAKANLDATQLIAPIDGVITAITLNVGDNAGTSAAVTISNTVQPYTLDVYLDETDWDKARVGFDATITFDMLPNKTYPGKVTEVFPALDRSSGTPLAHIRVQLNSNINVDLPAGATGSVDIIGGKTLGAIIVPISALKEVQPGKYVVYLMKNNQPVEQSVEIGLEDIVNAEVKSGLKLGDVVMTNATDKK